MQHQPYRNAGSRQPSQALTAMQRGRTAQGGNSADIWRATQRLMRMSAPKKRPARPARTTRPPRPPR